MDNNSVESNQKLPTNQVSKEERYLRMFFTYLKLNIQKIESKKTLYKLLIKDPDLIKSNLEILKKDWITLYYNIYDYFISKEENLYTYFFTEIIFINQNEEEIEKKEILKNLVLEMMKICIKIYPPSREDIRNYYQYFRSIEMNKNLFSSLMEIFNIIYTKNNESSFKEYFDTYNDSIFFLFDSNSHIEIKLDQEWIDSPYREQPTGYYSKSFFVIGFSFRYFKKNNIFHLVELKFPNNKYLGFSIRNGFLHCNIPFKNNIQIPMKEDTYYSFTVACLETRVQIHINDTFYETSQGIDNVPKFIIVGDKFFGIFFKIYSTFTLEPLTYNKDINFMQPTDGKCHFYLVCSNNVYESLTNPKVIKFLKLNTFANVNFSERVLLFNSDNSYMKSLKNYGDFASITILLFYFIKNPDYYKKEYIKLICDKIYEQCSISSNVNLFSDNNYFIQMCLTLINFPVQIRDKELVDYIQPLIKFSCGFNFYFDILKFIYKYEPEKDKQPFSFHLIEVMIKKLLKIQSINELNEIRDILNLTLEHYNLKLEKSENNVAEDIYKSILLYFENYKSPDENIYFNVPNFFWFIMLYIYFFELKDKIKEIKIIYDQLENTLFQVYNEYNKIIIQILNNYILLSNKQRTNYIFSPQNEVEKTNYIYITYIFKLYSRYKKNNEVENLININLKDIKNVFSNFKYSNIEDFKSKKILYFLIPTVYNLPYITKQFKDDENSLILHLLCEDIFKNETKDTNLLTFIYQLKDICINLKYVDTKSNGYLIYYIKKEIYKELKTIDYEVPNSFYINFERDQENAKNLNIDISNIYNDLYKQLEKDKKDNKTNHEITKEKLKEYLDPSDDLFQSDYLISQSEIEEILNQFCIRKNWIKTTLDDQVFYNQNWTDFNFCYNSENKNPKFTIKYGGSTNDLKFPCLYRIPDITKVIKHRNQKGNPEDKLEEIFKEIPEEPFPINVHISTKEIKQNLNFFLKYHEDLNLQIENEYITDNKKKFSCCVTGILMGKGFFYIKNEDTIEYQNYYEIERGGNYNCIDQYNGISLEHTYFYNPSKIYRITIKKEDIKMFIKRIDYYEDQGLEIYLFSGGSWYFVFQDKRDEFLEEAGLIEKNETKDNNIKEELYIYDSDWRSNYMFRIVYNDLNFKSSIFHKTILKEPIAYVSKYFKFPDDNEYWENTCLSDILKRWKEHKISTYTLIMYLNIFSGRTSQDKSQYPIYPLLILNSNNGNIVYRNLKLPIGQQKINNQQNLQRISYFDSIYQNEKDKNNAFYYPCSFSSQKSSLKFLSTLFPYSQIAKSIYSDNNNIINSINKETIDSLTNENNINESIPDFFYLPEVLCNLNKIKDIKDEFIELPSLNLINNTNYKFDPNIIYTLTLNKILESKEVNDTIGNWIDLIFGIDQHSEKHKNIFKPECYINDKKNNEIYKNNKEIIKNYKTIGTLPLQIIKSSKFSSLITRKYLPLNLTFPIKESITIKLQNSSLTELINFTSLNSEIFIAYGEGKIWNINIKNIKENQSFTEYPIYNKRGVYKEYFNPKVFKRIFSISRSLKYSLHTGCIDDVIIFYNHRKLNSGYNHDSYNKRLITAVELIEYFGYEHYLLIGKLNGHIHKYKIDFESIDDLIKNPGDNEYPEFYYKSILRAHNKEIISMKYNSYLNMWISCSKDCFVHIWNTNGYILLSVFVKCYIMKYALLFSDPIPGFIVYFDNVIQCFLLNQIKPLRILEMKSEVYNFEIVKSNCFEDFLFCQDDNKIYVISIPYLQIVHEINEKFTTFDYLSNERLIIGFLRHNDENKVTIKKIKCDI